MPCVFVPERSSVPLLYYGMVTYAYVTIVEKIDKREMLPKAFNLAAVITLLNSQTTLYFFRYSKAFEGFFGGENCIFLRKHKKCKRRVAKSIYNEE
jgi:hypothetical protein